MDTLMFRNGFFFVKIKRFFEGTIMEIKLFYSIPTFTPHDSFYLLNGIVFSNNIFRNEML